MLTRLRIFKSWHWLSALVLSLVCSPAFASVSFNSAMMEENMGYALQIIQDFSIIAGVALLLGSLFRFKKYSEGRSMMMQQRISGPILMLLGGTMLLYLPQILGTALFNFWGYIQPLQPDTPSYLDGFEPSLQAITMALHVIGVVAFIRGIFKVARGGRENSQPGMLGKGLLLMFVGILLVHIMGTVHLVEQLMGVTV